MVKGRQIHDALLLPFRHIADQRRLVLIGQAARSHRTGKDPVTVPLDIQVKSAGHRRRHVGMTAKTANLPTYADGTGIRFETHRQAGGHFRLLAAQPVHAVWLRVEALVHAPRRKRLPDHIQFIRLHIAAFLSRKHHSCQQENANEHRLRGLKKLFHIPIF